MKLLTAAVLVNILALYNVYADEGVDPEPFPSTKTPVTSSTSASTTKSTTSATTPSTTSTTTTSTTSAPHTTSTSAPITTASTTSSPSTTSSTTSSPVTTPGTTVAPTSTNQPSSTPTPPTPQPGTWQVNTTINNTACILLKMVAVLEVNYTNLSNSTEEAQMYIPLNATSTGSCGANANSENQSIKLTWSFVNVNLTDSLEFEFTKNDSKFELQTVNISLTLDTLYFPTAKDANKSLNLVHQKVDFITPTKMSYKCDKEQTLNLYEPNSNVTKGTLKISEFQFQAFANITDKKFAEAKDCAPYETPDVVPIAVGCALMALIIIVLIGYLIGRRRNQARGYLSM